MRTDKYVEVLWNNKPFVGLNADNNYSFPDLELAFDAAYIFVTKKTEQSKKISLKQISFMFHVKKADSNTWGGIKLSYFLLKDFAYSMKWMIKHRKIEREVPKELTSV